MANPQPEEDAAQWRRRRAIRRVDQVLRDDHLLPDPGRGGARGYPLLLRRRLMSDYQAGQPVPASMVRSIRRWIKERHRWRVIRPAPSRRSPLSESRSRRRAQSSHPSSPQANA